MWGGRRVEEGETTAIFAGPGQPYPRHLVASLRPIGDDADRPGLGGGPPNLADPPAGCRFHPRCPLAMDVCRTTVPKELDFAGHKVRCHAVEKELAGGKTDPIALSQVIRDQLAEQTAAPAGAGIAP